MARALQRKLTSIDVSDPRLYQDDTGMDAVIASVAKQSMPPLAETWIASSLRSSQ